MKKRAPSDIPAALYRLQLNESFPLKCARAVLPYLNDLGVGGVYLSPIFDAFSPHGYDVTNPNALNPALGTPEDLDAFCAALHTLNLKLFIDIVPNHMGFKGGKNQWWQEMLKGGENSPYASYFDIEWHCGKPELDGKILLPILGDHPERCEIVREGEHFRYGDYSLPLAPGTTLLEEQHYRLAYWKTATHEINYRRFFNINDLVAIRMEEEKVFDEHHRWVFELIKEGKVDGLRVDHPDGLYDPVRYFQRLREKTDIPVIVEKILDRNEELPHTWEVDGTVGYETINLINGLFVDKRGEAPLTQIYADFIGEALDYNEVLYDCKKRFATEHMVSEVERLCRDLQRPELAPALEEVISTFPVYRSYIRPKGGILDRDVVYIKEALLAARTRAPHIDSAHFDFLENILLLKTEASHHRQFILRFQQLTAPIMAKGLEDTSFYIYNRLLSLNEVGGEPLHFGTTPEVFHRFNEEKLRAWPLGFIASSTHDTKRSEDVRARLNVLSEIPQEWAERVKTWASLNAKIEGPTANDAYMLYQMLLGAWPRSVEELWPLIEKSLREARLNTDWDAPNHAYERSVRTFLEKILEPQSAFLKDFLPFYKRIDRLGKLNSLAATALKLGSPGIVDIFQGCEDWNYRLVDPDNRAPVNFERLQKEASEKQKLHRLALNFRRQHPRLFLEGEYVPLEVVGERKEHLIAFMRRFEKERIIVLAGRFFATLEGWGDTAVILPDETPLTDLFTNANQQGQMEGGKCLLPIRETFSTLPVSYLYDRNTH